jgi:hypothetical protein
MIIPSFTRTRNNVRKCMHEVAFGQTRLACPQLHGGSGVSGPSCKHARVSIEGKAPDGRLVRAVVSVQRLHRCVVVFHGKPIQFSLKMRIRKEA